jgi:hypothetical protein
MTVRIRLVYKAFGLTRLDVLALRVAVGRSAYVGNGNFRYIVKPKPLDKSKRNFVELMRSAGRPTRPKFITIGGGSLLP